MCVLLWFCGYCGENLLVDLLCCALAVWILEFWLLWDDSWVSSKALGWWCTARCLILLLLLLLIVGIHNLNFNINEKIYF